MARAPETLVFVPAWNEEANLPAVLDELGAGLPEADVLVIDDGSTDRTAEVARAHGAHVLSFGENRGLRAAIAAGWDWAREHEYELVGRIDADGQHPVAELSRLLQTVRAGECDVAVGSRFVVRRGLPRVPLPPPRRHAVSARRSCAAPWQFASAAPSATRRAG